MSMQGFGSPAPVRPRNNKHIDVNRGVTMKIHPSGVRVYMYKDEPGFYLSGQGTPVGEDLAREAGFDVAQLGKKRAIKEKMAEAQARILADMELAQEGRKVLAERQGFQLVDIGYGRHQVLGPDGILLTPQWLPLEQGQQLFEQLVPEGKDD